MTFLRLRCIYLTLKYKVFFTVILSLFFSQEVKDQDWNVCFSFYDVQYNYDYYDIIMKYTFFFIRGKSWKSAKLSSQRSCVFWAPPLEFQLNQWHCSMCASRGAMPLGELQCFKLWSANWIALSFLCLHCSPSCGFPARHYKQPQWIFSMEERLIYVDKQIQSPSEAF